MSKSFVNKIFSIKSKIALKTAAGYFVCARSVTLDERWDARGR